MSIWRRIAIWFVNFCLGLILLLMAVVISIIYTVGSASYIKTSFKETGFYDKFTGSILKLADAQSVNQTSDNQVLAELTPVVKKSVTPEFVQNGFETAVDSFDNWLNGKTQNPNFSIDLSQIRASLVSQTAVYFQARISGLPPCQSYKSYNFYQDYDPINATCRPPVNLTDADYRSAAEYFISDVLPADKQTANFNPLNIQPSAPKTFASDLPIYNKIFRLLPWILGILGAVCIALVIFLNRSKARALRSIGHTFVWPGVILLLSGALTILIFGRGSTSYVSDIAVEQVDFVKNLLAPLLMRLVVSCGYWAIYLGAGYTLFGLMCYFAGHYLKLKELKSTPKIKNRPAPVVADKKP
jgi:hypothetical protein